MPLQKDYANQIVERLTSQGLYADVDNSDNTLPKKIRNGEIAQYNFILGELVDSLVVIMFPYLSQWSDKTSSMRNP